MAPGEGAYSGRFSGTNLTVQAEYLGITPDPAAFKEPSPHDSPPLILFPHSSTLFSPSSHPLLTRLLTLHIAFICHGPNSVYCHVYTPGSGCGPFLALLGQCSVHDVAL